MMLKLWAPTDQTTPKASERPNPFDPAQGDKPSSQIGRIASSTKLPSLQKQNSSSSIARSPAHHLLLADHNRPLTPVATTGQPTTQVSLVSSEFKMQPPPLKRNHTASSTATINGQQGSARGQLHIKVIQARGLNAKSLHSRPYVVVQFEHSEFFSREPTSERDKEVKGVPQPLSRNSSSSALTSLAASGIARAFDAASRARTGTQPNTLSAGSGTSTPGGLLFGGSMSPHNPVWKHEVSFDVTSDKSLITFSIYDRAYDDEQGFLGMLEVKPILIHDQTVDQWIKLVPRDTEHTTGELRVQITYEQYQTKRILTPRDFDFLKLIGRGTFGRVFQVRKKDTRRIYAMKVLSKKEIVAKKEIAHTIGERKILQASLECPFLVGLKFSFQTSTELFLVTDFKSGGELFYHLQKEHRFSEERARFYIAELVLALEHLHKYDIVYRDLKPENILLDATGHVALCDFGLSKPDLPSDQLTNTFCGTTEYLAPEVLLDDSGYSKLVDFWSLGVLLFEMCTGYSPFYAEDTQTMYRNICFGKIRFPKNVIGDDGKQFVKGLLNRNPKHRLGSQRDAQDLKEHAFFKSIDWKALSLKQVTPPFKPVVESEESVANFDTEFTQTDLKDAGLDFYINEEDEAQGGDWDGLTLKKKGGVVGSAGSTGTAVSSNAGTTLNGGSLRTGMEIGKQDAKKKGKKGMFSTGSPPLTSSVQENFRGFTYVGESMMEAAAAAGGMGVDGVGDDEVLDMVDGDEGGGGGTDDEWEDEQRLGGRYAGQKPDLLALDP